MGGLLLSLLFFGMVSMGGVPSSPDWIVCVDFQLTTVLFNENQVTPPAAMFSD